MLGEVARLTKPFIRPTQGSFNTTVTAWAGTHGGGGAVDVSVRHWSGATITDVVRTMRTVGFAAWHRLPAEGPWPAHIHGIAIGCDGLGPAAQRQVDAYRAGKNELKSGKRDTGPQVGFGTFEQYLSKGRPPDVLPTVSVGRLRKAALADTVGHFGSKTVEAFAAWQRRLGFSGADADGIPGRTSLGKLGIEHGFVVND
jgi:hypothetical protein